MGSRAFGIIWCGVGSQIALQLAVTFAKVARMDFPKAWPSLVTDVMATATASPLAARRAYLVLHHILKELSTKRLAADQETFAQVSCAHIFDP